MSKNELVPSLRCFRVKVVTLLESFCSALFSPSSL